jgi:hypothetical protein
MWIVLIRLVRKLRIGSGEETPYDDNLQSQTSFNLFSPLTRQTNAAERLLRREIGRQKNREDIVLSLRADENVGSDGFDDETVRRLG